MVKVGIVGIGFMGLIHYQAYQRLNNVRVAAIVSRSEKKRRGDWRGIQGNFGPAGEIMDLGAVKAYETLEQLLNDDDIDLVDICLPTAQHAGASITALEAGKHVLCEKPIALTLEDAQAMAAAQTSSLFMIAHVLPFFGEYRFLRDLQRDRRYGILRGGQFKRIISNPTWIPDYFNPLTTRGPLIDLHIHDAHFIRLLCGLPPKLYSRGHLRGEVVSFARTEFVYPENEPLLSAVCGIIDQQGRPFTQAYEIYFEEATVLFDAVNFTEGMHVAMPLTVLERDGSILRPQLGPPDPISAFADELAEAVGAVESGRPSELLAGTLARDALLLCLKQEQSVKEDRMVEVLAEG